MIIFLKQMSEAYPPFECACCLCEFEDSQQMKYQLYDSDQWIGGAYCFDCTNYIHKNRWKILKDGLLGVDCLAEFKRIQKSGIPTSLLERDLSTNIKSDIPVKALNVGEIVSAQLTMDLTNDQVSSLSEELKTIDSGDGITDGDIRNITQKYWC
jgi:hypothetical protein